MSRRHRWTDEQPFEREPDWRRDDDVPFDGCRRPICGHSAAAHDGPGGACGVAFCPCHSYAAPAYRLRVALAVLLALAAFVAVMAVISGAHP